MNRLNGQFSFALFDFAKKQLFCARDHFDLDYKLRLVDHLISDHGDRMAMANSVEARYPFLDKDLVEFLATVSPDLKLKDFQEKYILKQWASTDLVPQEIINRKNSASWHPGALIF